MVTRFYLSRATTTYTPSYSGSWDGTANADRYRCATSKSSMTMTTKTANCLSLGTPQAILIRQYISDKLQAQTISGTVKGQMRCIESTSAVNGVLAVLIKVIDDSGNLRGTLLTIQASDDYTTVPPEMATSLTNRPLQDATEATSLTLSSVDAQANDHIVIELGAYENTTTTTRTCGISFGDNNATDLGENSTDTTAYNPWIEFSGDITFAEWKGNIAASSDDALVSDAGTAPHTWDAITLNAESFRAGAESGDGVYYGSGGRWLNVQIPQGATINSAYLKVVADYAKSGTGQVTQIQGEDTDDAATFSTLADYNGRTRTTASVAWSSIASWSAGTEYTSPDIKTVIQEIVDRAGWASGNDLVLFWEDNGSTYAQNDREAAAYDNSTYTEPRLEVTFTVGGAVTYTKTFTINGELLKTQTKTFTVNATLLQSLTKTFTAGAELTFSGTKTFTVNAELQGTRTKTFTVNGDLLKVQTKTFTVNAELQLAVGKSFTANADLLKSGTKAFTINADLLLTGQTKTFSVNAELLKTQTKSFTVDAELQLGAGTYTKTFTVNGELQSSIVGGDSARYYYGKPKKDNTATRELLESVRELLYALTE